ncbi:MAG: DUF3489 domain-containing protein [Pseudomonadota bacterium]|tara:strand:- start:1362 stop:1724 length:363 start_codon:yes stop_codon:yes gene_type:complete
MKPQSNKTTTSKPTKKTAPQHSGRLKPTAVETKPKANVRATTRSSKPSETAPRPPSKLNIIIEMLKRPDGVTINDLSAATGWQTHSVRGFLSGTVKKRLGLTLTSETSDKSGRRYRIIGA